MLEPGSDEATDLRILDSYVRRFQYHHPESVHGIERRTTKTSLHVRQKLCDFEFKFLAILATGDIIEKHSMALKRVKHTLKTT